MLRILSGRQSIHSLLFWRPRRRACCVVDIKARTTKASPSKRAGFHLAFTWGKPSPPTRAGSLSRFTRANYIYFPTKPGIRYLRIQGFILYPTHKQTELVKWKVLKKKKKCWPRQTTLSCVRSFDLLALLGGPALLSAFIWNIFSPPTAKEDCRSPRINENKFWQRI